MFASRRSWWTDVALLCWSMLHPACSQHEQRPISSFGQQAHQLLERGRVGVEVA
jgi:hypothetical protein